MKLLEFIFSTWYILLVFLILFFTILEAVKGALQHWSRHKTLRKNGYPPSHCDVDGYPVSEYVDLAKQENKD